jgi:multidrug efflux system outer membrane protein
MRRLFIAALLSVLAAGCAVGPRYQRPAVSLPDAYRGAATQSAAAAESLGDQEWAKVFRDEKLQELIRTALEKNYDVRIAASRILQAEAQVSITHADEYPTVDAGLDANNQRTAASRFSAFNISEIRLSGTASWEIDFWKKFRSATAAARATLLATQWSRQAVIRTLVSDLASAYFQLRELDSELEISKRTLASRQDSLQLIRLIADRGLTSMLDVHQAEQLVYTASGAIPDLEQRIEQHENQVSILTGNIPNAIPRGLELTAEPMAAEVPAGLPSSLLERRPDIREAEQNLIALDAEISAIRARAFPKITLTATSGFQSASLASLFSGPAGFWTFAGALAQPVFQKGKLGTGIRLAEAQREEAELVYQQTVQQAFREVSDALIAYRKTQEFRQQQEQLFQSAGQAAQLSEVRYRGGVTNYLEVLTNESSVFTAERGLAQAHLAERLALVQLYKALGGGWQP